MQMSYPYTENEDCKIVNKQILQELAGTFEICKSNEVQMKLLTTQQDF